jgi:hypothetical protein
MEKEFTFDVTFANCLAYLFAQYLAYLRPLHASRSQSLRACQIEFQSVYPEFAASLRSNTIKKSKVSATRFFGLTTIVQKNSFTEPKNPSYGKATDQSHPDGAAACVSRVLLSISQADTSQGNHFWVVLA